MAVVVAVLLVFAVPLQLFAENPARPAAGVSFDVGFSPGGTSLAVVEKAIGAAKSEILMACYEFTSRDIAETLEAAAHRGVKVMIVADWKAAHDRYSQTGILQDAGIPVRLDHHYAIHHHKFMVIDEASLETGSFNYTTAAIKHNAENALVIWNVPQVAHIYAAEWRRLWEESKER
ncbi:MAG: phospholipase D family protein [Spirochaetia bacterium]